MNEVRIVVTGDGRSAKAALAEARADWLGFGRDVEQVGASASASTRKMNTSVSGDLAGVSASFDRGGDHADGFAKSTDRASSEASRSIKRMRRDIDDALSGIGDISIGVGGVDIGGLFDGVEEEAEEAGEKAGEGFTRGAEGRLRDAKGRFTSSGKGLGDGAADGFLKGMSPIVGKASLITGAVGAGLMALGPVGQLAGGAVALGLGGGLAAIGVMSAAKSEEVKAHWTNLGASITDELDDIDEPIEEALMRIPQIAKTAFSGIKSDLESSFAEIGPALEEAAEDWGDTLGGADISAETNGFVQVLDAIGFKSDEIGEKFGAAFDEMADTAAEHADDIAATISVLGSVIEGLANSAGWVADEFDQNLSNLEKIFEGLGPVASGVLGGMAGDLDNSGEAAARAASGAREAAMGWAEAAGEADILVTSVETLNAAFKLHLDPAQAALDASIKWKETLAELKKATAEANLPLIEREKVLSDSIANLEGSAKAEMALHDSVRDTSEAFTENLPKLVELAEGSEEGRENIEGLAKVLGVDLVEAGEGAFITVNKAGEAIKIFPDGKTVKLDADIKSMESELKRAKSQLDDKDLSRERKAKLNADIRALEAAVRQAKQYLDSLKDKTVTVTVRQVRSDINTSSGGGYALATGGIVGGIGAFADGGAVGPRSGLYAESGSTLALVGEQGPEIARLPYGTTIIPAGQTDRMLGEGALRGYASGGPLGSSIHIPAPSTSTSSYGGNLLGAFDPRSGSSGGRVELNVVNPQHATASSPMGSYGGGGWGGSWPGGGSGGGGSVPGPGPQEDTTSTYAPITRPGGGKVPAVIDSNPVPANRRGDDFGAGFFAGQTGVSVAGFSGAGGGGGSGGGGSGGGVGLVVNVYVQGSIRAERDIEEIVQNALLRGGFRGALS